MPEIEQINRNFNEGTRFYNTHQAERKHGLKFVPKPVTDTVQELLDEQANTEIKNPNYLLNPRYDSDMGRTDPNEGRYTNRLSREHSRNYTQLMTRTGSSEGPVQHPERLRQRSSVFRPSPYYELVPGMKSSVEHLRKPLYMDKEGNKLLYRPTGRSHKNSSVKLYQTGKLRPSHFVFPRRRRFNEDADKEIKSQRSQSKGEFQTAQYLNAKVLDKAGKDHTDNKSRFSKSKKTMTVGQLNRFFSDKKTVNTKLNHSLSKGRPYKVDKSVSYVRRMVIDSGNPRYAASKHSSFLGGLTTG